MSGLGPWLQTAVLCEEIRDDGDGRIAAIGVLDGIAIEAGERVSAHLVIVVVRGGWVGPIELRVVAFDPQGEPISRIEAEGDPPPIPYAQARIVVPIELAAGSPGVFWFDIQLGGETVTRVPMRVDWRTLS
ncbi:MAG TPA: hypothetical protein VFQ53_37675 [Kofleriaceae bacterium]|nr:hypothetical protein [Kofleriaceae bacterium]